MRCICGCSIGLHFHTNHPASCAKCGPKKCKRFKEAVLVPATQLPANRTVQLGRLSAGQIVIRRTAG